VTSNGRALAAAARIVLAALLFMAGCSSDEEPDETAVSTPLVEELPRRCRGFESDLSADAQISFIAGGRFFVTTAAGAEVQCIEKGIDPGRIAWGGEADRVLIDGPETTLFTEEAGATLDSDQQATSWSRPTGTSVISVSPSGHLLKQAAEKGKPVDISFLKRHDEAIYHPAGTHIATVGDNEFDVYGLYISNNEGKDDQLIAVGESAKRIYNLAFNHSGDFIYYAAEHPNRFDLHSLKIVKAEVGLDEPVESRLGTLYSGEEDVTNVVVSEFSEEPLIAFQTGCRTHVVAGNRESLIEGDLAERNTEPVGWLPDGTLVVLAYDNGCSGPGDLLEVNINEATSVLIANAVESAGIRAVLPPPPNPPDVDTGVVA
jgi:hypothetical protein